MLLNSKLNHIDIRGVLLNSKSNNHIDLHRVLFKSQLNNIDLHGGQYDYICCPITHNVYQNTRQQLFYNIINVCYAFPAILDH